MVRPVSYQTIFTRAFGKPSLESALFKIRVHYIVWVILSVSGRRGQGWVNATHVVLALKPTVRELVGIPARRPVPGVRFNRIKS